MIVLTMGLVAEARLDKTSWSCEQAMSCCTALQHTVTVLVIWCTAQCCLKGIAFCAGKGCLTTRLPSHVLSSCLPLHADFFLRSFGADYWLQGLFGFEPSRSQPALGRRRRAIASRSVRKVRY